MNWFKSSLNKVSGTYDAQSGRWTSSDGFVSALIDVKPGEYVSIYQWGSKSEGKGYTNKALAELAQQFGTNNISAVGIGEEGMSSYNYWVNQAKKKRVNLILDDDDQEVDFSKLAAATIMPFDVDNTPDDAEYDPYEYADQAEQAFQKSNIHVQRNKNISHVAVEDGRVIGAVQSAWEQEGGYGHPNIWVFSFDVAVDPEFRRPPNLTGLKLIKEAVDYYERTKTEYTQDGEQTMMRLWVVNPRLVPVLEQRYGFQMESDHGEGGAHLIRY